MKWGILLNDVQLSLIEIGVMLIIQSASNLHKMSIESYDIRYVEIIYIIILFLHYTQFLSSIYMIVPIFLYIFRYVIYNTKNTSQILKCILYGMVLSCAISKFLMINTYQISRYFPPVFLTSLEIIGFTYIFTRKYHNQILYIYFMFIFQIVSKLIYTSFSTETIEIECLLFFTVIFMNEMIYYVKKRIKQYLHKYTFFIKNISI